jgi:hypothetical protein
MRKFRLRIFEANGKWFFRWDNVDVPTKCRLTMPLPSKALAESRMHDFIDAERAKRPWTIFEYEDPPAPPARLGAESQNPHPNRKERG